MFTYSHTHISYKFRSDTFSQLSTPDFPATRHGIRYRTRNSRHQLRTQTRNTCVAKPAAIFPRVTCWVYTKTALATDAEPRKTPGKSKDRENFPPLMSDQIACLLLLPPAVCLARDEPSAGDRSQETSLGFSSLLFAFLLSSPSLFFVTIFYLFSVPHIYIFLFCFIRFINIFLHFVLFYGNLLLPSLFIIFF